jgi:RNA polymerase sigma-70 factor (ECF subfamily)
MALQAWLYEIAQGKEAALGSFYDATIGRVYGLALRILRDAAEAEDVAAEVYVQVWQQASAYSAERGAPLSWLLVLCRSRALDRLRRREPAQTTEDIEAVANAQGLQGDDPQDLLAAVENGGRVHQALAKLSEIQRRLIGLAFFEDLSHQEIAARVGIPLGTVKSHIRRGLLCLKQELGEMQTVS